MCGACKRDATEAARAIEREALRHPGGVIATAATSGPTEPTADAPVPSAPTADAS